MSALPSEADIRAGLQDVCFVPSTDLPPALSTLTRRAAKRAAGTDSEELFRGRWHRRGMMVDNEPILTTLDVSEAVARRQALGLSVLDIGKRVIAGIDRRTAVHSD